jgi:hypothetical protein
MIFFLDRDRRLRRSLLICVMELRAPDAKGRGASVAPARQDGNDASEKPPPAMLAGSTRRRKESHEEG